jgi:DNA-binding PadR family transcriptional regulator
MAKPLVELKNLTKSCNEALILATLAQGAKHGYQMALDISEQSEGLFGFNHGTLYPILHKLEKDGLIKGVWDPTTKARKRKNYELTAKGQKYLEDQREGWSEFMNRFSKMIGLEAQ